MVVSGNVGIGVPLRNILSDYIENIAHNIADRIEIGSIEHQLFMIDQYNELVKRMIESGELDQDSTKDFLLVGADVKALFPSMSAVDVQNLLTMQLKVDYEIQPIS